MRIPTHVRAPAALALAAGLSLSLTACGDDAADQQASGAAGSQSSGTDSERNGDGGNPLENGPDDNGADAAREISPTACLVGTWLADNQQLGALFKNAAAGTEAQGALSDPTGEVLVTFGPGEHYSVTYEAWTMSMSQDGMTIELVRSGTDEGSYEATDDGAVAWTEVTAGSVVTMKSPAGTMEVPGEPSGTSGTFVCEGESLEITAEGGTTAFAREG